MLLDYIEAAGLSSIGVGKIYDIFAGQGVTEMVRNKSNADGMDHTFDYAAKDFEGLCFVNLVDFDMLYGHRNDVDGYANALTEFDGQLRRLQKYRAVHHRRPRLRPLYPQHRPFPRARADAGLGRKDKSRREPGHPSHLCRPCRHRSREPWGAGGDSGRELPEGHFEITEKL